MAGKIGCITKALVIGSEEFYAFFPSSNKTEINRGTSFKEVTTLLENNVPDILIVDLNHVGMNLQSAVEVFSELHGFVVVKEDDELHLITKTLPAAFESFNDFKKLGCFNHDSLTEAISTVYRAGKLMQRG